MAQFHQRRTKKELTIFLQFLADRLSNAVKMWVVQDSLNTHDFCAFQKYPPADQARALANPFEFYIKPKESSWLNGIELQLPVLDRQRVNGCNPKMEKLEREVWAFVADRTAKKALIKWQFSQRSACTKLSSPDDKVHLALNNFMMA